ncbi:hypothetical protein N657DRAFT_134892 [Parathielavia appendiculata]|uniref:Uncharacterized protein n=1 Tax=Parathielavia appendiculata TaxID=2587402 RepID=A0AAN6TUN3_9PEZI|nr:hypothetical protein N657DRAFT_134892 [Parathielavia appendiculata]
MRFTIPALLVVSATACLADMMRVITVCPSEGLGRCDSSRGTFPTCCGHYPVDANEGRRGTGVPGMVEFCVDWGNRRGHFRFSHQSFKRCMCMASEQNMNLPLICPTNGSCIVSDWEEIPCSWREVPAEPEAIVSATEEEAAPVETGNH